MDDQPKPPATKNEKLVSLVKKRKLTGKQRAFIAEYIKNGKNGVQAALKVYDTGDYNSANQISVENLQKPTIKDEIEKALIKLEATPEFAVQKIKNIAELTDVNPSAALNASVKILELHGWKAGERPAVTLSVKNAFFGTSKKSTKQDNVIDV